MVEKTVLVRRLTLLEEYCSDLEVAGQTINWEDFSHDKIIHRYVERTLHMGATGTVPTAHCNAMGTVPAVRFC